LGNEVGLAYQSPPPLYFSKAIFKEGASLKVIKEEKVKRIRMGKKIFQFFINDF
jgi:hypothetical protein